MRTPARIVRAPLAGVLLVATMATWRAFAQDAPPALPPVPGPATTTADLGQPFATRHAAFEPRAFADLPGWREDSLAESADGMRQSCAALRRKPVWSELCAQFARASGGGVGALHAFFEDNFYAYQVMSPARTREGKLTGYFEPLLDGSARRDAQYRYPVYGMPQDLVLLDARAAGGTSAWLARNGQRLVPAAPDAAGAVEYELALQGANLGVRDKRYRLRVDGRRLVPYWSRQDIERQAIPAPVLAWVDDAYKLYSMQIQGSGKVRLREGGLVRVAYAEQNGHPFRPRLTRGGDATFALTEIKARGLIAGSTAGAARARPASSTRVSAPVNAEVARIIAALGGQNGSARPASAATPARPPDASSPPPAPPRPASAAPSAQTDAREVAAMISALKGQGPAPPPRPVGEVAPVSGDGATGASPRPAGDARPDTTAGTATSGFAGGATTITDPSYVFFRAIGDGPEGPIGALGVPLSAERSLAVDPRTTPLGAPVFISSIQPGGEGPMRKLMFAQDTGGAIRGSVRADFFWGFGDEAGRLALATNEVMQMWLLLPKRQQISAVAAQGMRLRGSTAALPDCVIADEDLCVED